MIHYRHATRNDVEQLLSLIEKGFSIEFNSVINHEKGREHRVLFSYLYSKEDWDPEWVYLAEESGRLVAAVGFFPQILYFDGVEVPIWAVSPVVTDPEYRGKGFAGICLTRALEDLKDRGVPGVFLWGLPEYYPRFGFVPVLPRYKTKLTPGKLISKAEYQGRFRSVKFEDLSQVASIYNNVNSKYWLQPKRDLKWWENRYEEIGIQGGLQKEVPFPKKENFLVWENNKGEVKGYLNYLEEQDQKIVINESAVAITEDAIDMVTSMMGLLFSGKTIYFRGTPIHSLNIAAYRLGGTHINPAPRAGMVKVIDWERFLSYLLPIINDRSRLYINFKDGDIFELGILDGRIRWVWHESAGWEIRSDSGIPQTLEQEKLFTRLIFGFYDQIDLSRFSSKYIEIIERLFPKKYPFIWDNNYLY